MVSTKVVTVLCVPLLLVLPDVAAAEGDMIALLSKSHGRACLEETAVWRYSQKVSPSSVKGSILRSALLPGWGEFRLGKYQRGKWFVRAEVGLWLTFLQNLRVASMYESRFEAFASLHAGIDLRGKDDQFFVDIGNYSSLEAFNDDQQRARYPFEVYPANAGYDWEWDREMNRGKFRDFRVRRDLAKKVARFTIAAMVVNRIISMVDVSYLHKTTMPAASVSLVPSMSAVGEQIHLTLAYSF